MIRETSEGDEEPRGPGLGFCLIVMDKLILR